LPPKARLEIEVVGPGTAVAGPDTESGAEDIAAGRKGIVAAAEDIAGDIAAPVGDIEAAVGGRVTGEKGIETVLRRAGERGFGPIAPEPGQQP